MSRRWRWIAILLLLLVASVLAAPAPRIPVAGASPADWNQQTFWHYPWGASGVHKGIDIFAARGTAALAPVSGVVVYSGVWPQGGEVVLLLGPGWQIHYLAHLERRTVSSGQWLTSGDSLGTVGDSGNARGKPAHLHYSIVDLLPRPWRIDGERQGWKKMFYRNPSLELQR